MRPVRSKGLNRMIWGCAGWCMLLGGIASAQSNTYWRTIGIDPSIYDSPFSVSLFNPTQGEDRERLWSQTQSLFVYGLGVLGVLYTMPEEMTGWDRDSDLFGKWVENVKEGPVWDRDNWAYNYIGHTYSGGVYYQIARKSGYRQWDAFIYSGLLSTFYWEYGVEAFAEPPSIQDLAVTPLMGWVYGEWAYQTEISIRKQNNRVAGSRLLGNTVLCLLDPVDQLGAGINRLTGRSWIKAGYGYFSYTATPHGDATDHTVYLNMAVPIGTSRADPVTPLPTLESAPNDPVDTGTVGISLHTGYLLPDHKTEMEKGRYTKTTLGLYFTPRISTRLAYSRGTMQEETSGENHTYENYSLDTQLYLRTRHVLRPYLSFGFGEQLWDENRENKSFEWNGGVGLHWKLHEKWALQIDNIHYYSPRLSTLNQTFNAGLIYRFGPGE